MEWIDTLDKKPTSHWHIVLVTDGKIVCLARWIEDVIGWYGEDLEDADGDKIEEEFHTPHWAFETDIGPFLGNDECFGVMEEIIAWMNLPLPPKDLE